LRACSSNASTSASPTSTAGRFHAQVAVITNVHRGAERDDELELDRGVKLDIFEGRLAIRLDLLLIENFGVDLLPQIIRDLAEQGRLAVHANNGGERSLARAEAGDFGFSGNKAGRALKRLLRALGAQLDSEVKLMVVARGGSDDQFFGQGNNLR
jgi:hypothetical protein